MHADLDMVKGAKLKSTHLFVFLLLFSQFLSTSNQQCVRSITFSMRIYLFKALKFQLNINL